VVGQDALPVNSLHYQTVKTLPEGVKASAAVVAGDGSVEAIEVTRHPRMLGVQ
jgi:gamma-glutamyl-gamma-aminobutyrate hydrolase PuuD